MPNPIVPNYVPGVGQLVTYRSDFESHVIGTGFRHQANQIDMSPLITISGAGQPSTVQDAIAALAVALFPPTIPNATIGNSTSNLGLITLGGDSAGTALTPKVIKLQGIPVATTIPTSGQVIIYNGSQWGPSAINLTGDVTGTNVSNKVTSISSPTTVSVSTNLTLQSGFSLTALNGSGIALNSGTTLTLNSGSFINGNINWVSTTTAPGFNPSITQASPTTDIAAGNLLIQAADAWVSAATYENGGNIVIATGNATGIGAFGTLTLQVGHSPFASPVLTTDVSGDTFLYGNGSKYIELNAFNSSVVLFPQATDGYCSLQIFENNNSINTQTPVNQIIPVTCRTTASAQTQIYSGTVASNSSVFIEVVWLLRNLVGSQAIASRGSIAAYADSSGTITFTNSGNFVDSYSGASGSNIVASSTGANNVTIKVHNPLITTVDCLCDLYGF